MEAVLEVLHKLVAMEVSPAVVMVLAAVVEGALRLIKTPKAVGLVHTLAWGIKKVSEVVALVAALVAKVADISDKVLPQKVEQPK